MSGDIQKEVSTQTTQQLQIRQQREEWAQRQAAPIQQIEQEQRLRPRGIKDKVQNLVNSTKREDAFGVRENEMYDNFAEERRQAFLEQLMINIECDQHGEDGVIYDSGFQAALSKIKVYVRAAQQMTDQHKEYALLADATAAIRDYMEHFGSQTETDAAHAPGVERMKMYQMHFDIFCRGSLRVPKDEIVQKYSDEQVRTVQVNSGHTYKDASAIPLFSHEPSIYDVRQGRLGDCYFLSALSSIALDHPEQIKQSMYDDGNGHVTVRFYKDGYDTLQELPKEDREFVMRIRDEKNPDHLTDTEKLFKLLTGMSMYMETGNEKQLVSLRAAYDRINAEVLQKVSGLEKRVTVGENCEEEREALDRYSDRLLNTFRDFRSSMAGCGYDSVAGLRMLSEELAGDEIFQTLVLKPLKNTSPEKWFDVGYECLLRGFAEEETSDVCLGRTNKGLMVDALTEKRSQRHPIYVTVDKTVVKGRWGDTYSEDVLWVQMMEKAYAASGLHRWRAEEPQEKAPKKVMKAKLDEYKEELQKENLPREIREYRLKKRQHEYMEKFRHTYVNINQGGDESDAVQALTGVTGRKHMIKRLDAGELEGKDMEHAVAWILAESIRKAFDARQTQFETENIPASIPDQLIFDLRDAMENELNKRGGVGGMDVQDMTELFRDCDSFVAAHRSQLQEAHLTEEQFKMLVEESLPFIEKDVEEAEKTRDLRIGYLPMSGRYGLHARREYDAVKKALQKKTPVAVETYRFKGSNKKGLNGETIGEGMVGTHVYSVIGLKEMDGKKFVLLRNPWASGENGYIKVTKPGEKPVFKNYMHKSGRSKGSFFIEWNDLLSKIDTICFNEEE